MPTNDSFFPKMPNAASHKVAASGMNLDEVSKD